MPGAQDEHPPNIPAGTAARAKTLRERIFMHFSQKAMVEGVLASYGEAFAKR